MRVWNLEKKAIKTFLYSIAKVEKPSVPKRSLRHLLDNNYDLVCSYGNQGFVHRNIIKVGIVAGKEEEFIVKMEAAALGGYFISRE